MQCVTGYPNTTLGRHPPSALVSGDHHRAGMVSGLFFGLAFGMGGIGAAVLGELEDLTNIELVYLVCA